MPRRTRTAGVLTGLVLVTGVLGGCGGDDKPDATGSPTPTGGASTPSPTTSPTSAGTGVPRPTMPSRPAYSKGRAGEERFARYVVAAWSYALSSNDISPLLFAGGGDLCTGCDVLDKTLHQRTKEHWSVLPFSVRVRKSVVAATDTKANVQLTVDLPETQSFFRNGSYRNTSPAHPGATFLVKMSVLKGAYRLDSFTLS
jgi:hypothetical protein